MTGIEIPSGKLNQEDPVADASLDESNEESEDGEEESLDGDFVDEEGKKPDDKKSGPKDETLLEGQQTAGAKK